MSDSHFFFVLLCLIVIYFVWMDIALYYKLQSGWDDLLVVQMYDGLNDTSSSSAPPPQGVAFFDPFNPISVKLLMVDHANHYLYYSACWWVDSHVLHVADKLTFVSPDAISISHVFVAAAAARMLVSDSVVHRRAGVVLFELRSLLDSYDGMVARARTNTRALTQGDGGWGYWMDGVCDAVGVVFFFAGVWLLLQKRSIAPRPRTRSHSAKSLSAPETPSPTSSSTENLLAVEEASSLFPASVEPGGSGGDHAGKLMHLSTVTVFALIGQQFISSFLWNRYMHGFHEILEVPYKVRGRLYILGTL